MKRRWVTLDSTHRMVSDDFGKLLKKYREDKGMSIQGLAKKSGVNASYIYRLEIGQRRRPGTFILEDISKALDIHPSKLIVVEYQKSNAGEIELEELFFTNDIVYKKQMISTESKEVLLDIIKIVLDSKWNIKTILSDLCVIGEAIGKLKE